MDFSEASTFLKMYGQESILNHFDTLSSKQKDNLLKQLSHFSFARWGEQKTLFDQKEKEKNAFLPWVEYVEEGDPKRIQEGKGCIEEGKVACVVFAGGQGTRLKYGGTKGMFPITPFCQKSLFQLLSEKVLFASKLAKKNLLLAIMTSTINDQEIKQFFQEHHFFGLKKDNLFFFTQENIPFLDETGNLFLQAPDTIAEGPDGNGSFFSCFFKSKCFSDWLERGIRYIHVLPIDNPLADPFDPDLVGLMDQTHDDIVVQAIRRDDAFEKLGVFVKKNEKPLVKEYYEIPEELKEEEEKKNKLLFPLANISVFVCAMDFIQQLQGEKKLPLHKVKKRIPAFFPDDEEAPLSLEGWKFETFWFDALAFSLHTSLLLKDRTFCFSPLKNVSGKNSIIDVQKAMEEKEKRMLENLTGKKAPEGPIELSPQFYYPTEEIKRKWKGKTPKEKGYIE